MKNFYSIPEFCEEIGIAVSNFYRLVKKGLMPRLMKVGGRRMISKEAIAAWRIEREREDLNG